MARFCTICGSFCEVENRMSLFGLDKIWCKPCNHYTKTIDLIWDFEEHCVIIIANYTKTDIKPTYSLHENNNFTQKHTNFERKWV